MCVKIFLCSIAALVSIFTFDAALQQQGLTVFNWGPVHSHWPTPRTPPPRPRQPMADEFVNLFNAAKVFNSSNFLAPEPLSESFFCPRQSKASTEEQRQPTHLDFTWAQYIRDVICNLLLCELRLFWGLERLVWVFLVGHREWSYKPRALRSIRKSLQIQHNLQIRALEDQHYASRKSQLGYLEETLKEQQRETLASMATEHQADSVQRQEAWTAQRQAEMREHEGALLSLIAKHEAENKQREEYAKTLAANHQKQIIANEGRHKFAEARIAEEHGELVKSRELEKSIRKECDGKLAALESAQLARAENERKNHEAAKVERQEQLGRAVQKSQDHEARANGLEGELKDSKKESKALRAEVEKAAAETSQMKHRLAEFQGAQDEYKKLLEEYDDTEQRNMNLEQQRRLAASKAEESEANVGKLRGELAELRKKVFYLQESSRGLAANWVLVLQGTDNKDVALSQSKAKVAEVHTELEPSRNAAAESRKEIEQLRKKCDKLEADMSLTSKNQAKIEAAEAKAKKALEVDLQVSQLRLAEATIANENQAKTLKSKQLGNGLCGHCCASGNGPPLGNVEVKQLQGTIDKLKQENARLKIANQEMEVDRKQALDDNSKRVAELGRENFWLKEKLRDNDPSQKVRPYGSSNHHLGASSASPTGIPGSVPLAPHPTIGQVGQVPQVQQQQPPLPPAQPQQPNSQQLLRPQLAPQPKPQPLPPRPPPQQAPRPNAQPQFPNLPWPQPNLQYQPPNMLQEQQQPQQHDDPRSQPQPKPQNQRPQLPAWLQQEQQPRPEAPAFIPYRQPRTVPPRQNQRHQESRGRIDPSNPGLLKKEW